jgi:tripartite-type tricarboxylate transporter receptor subunit TctC
MLAPAKTPREIISRLHGLLTTALEEPAVKQSLSEQGLIYRLSSPEEFGAFLASEIARWAKVIKENKIAVAD